MKLSTLTLLLFFTITIHGQNRIQVNIPTAESEAGYVWWTMHDINFFEKNNYQVSLPQGDIIDSLKIKARNNSLSDEDYETLEKFIRDSVYNKSNYEKGYKKIEAQLGLINKMISELGELQLDWPFKEYKTYQINLTLYGPGGSYDPGKGSILIYTTSTGVFKNYDNPACTIIHEIVHIGIQESIVDKYSVPHPFKERIVDNFVSLCFGKYLPGYRIQNMGDTRIDNYMSAKENLIDLEKTVETILN